MKEVSWFLEGSIAGGENLLIALEAFPFVIGRGSDCSLQLPGRHVSKRHAEINGFGSSISLHDLNSTNGTVVNGKTVTEQVSLKPGDLISIGGIELRLYRKEPEAEEDKTVVIRRSEETGDFYKRYGLTQKEKEVMELLAAGNPVAFIAETLGISKGTAKNHIVEIYRKTGVHARYELIELYRKF